MSIGPIIGIVLGSLLVLVALIALVFCVRKAKKKDTGARPSVGSVPIGIEKGRYFFFFPFIYHAFNIVYYVFNVLIFILFFLMETLYHRFNLIFLKLIEMREFLFLFTLLLFCGIYATLF